ncbi:MAG: hypothetical protein S4CHLAM20_06090 [Chlamydiia bacterium]|nr:hypothetical protein [Chlamydiia bacterium]
MNKFKLPIFFLLFLFTTSCVSNNAKTATSSQNDVMIHQLRVELEEMKHHIHTTVMQMSILTNKMVNSEDTIFELKQRDLILQKQLLDKQQEKLSKLEKKVDAYSLKEEERDLALNKMEEELKVQSKASHQNKKKIHELEKNALSLAPMDEKES